MTDEELKNIFPAEHKIQASEEALKWCYARIVRANPTMLVSELLKRIDKPKENLIKYLELKEPFDGNTLLKDLK